MYQRHTHKRDSQNCVVASFPFSIERRQEELFLKTNGRIIYSFVKTWSYFIRNDRNLLTVALFVKQQKTQKNLFLKRGNLENKKTWMNKKIVLFSLFHDVAPKVFHKWKMIWAQRVMASRWIRIFRGFVLSSQCTWKYLIRGLQVTCGAGFLETS